MQGFEESFQADSFYKYADEERRQKDIGKVIDRS